MLYRLWVQIPLRLVLRFRVALLKQTMTEDESTLATGQTRTFLEQQPGAGPTKIFSVNLRYAIFKYFDWLKNLSIQPDCLKICAKHLY